MRRTDVSFPSGSDQCAAWLYEPSIDDGGPADAADGGRRSGERPPLIVMAHGLGGIKVHRLDAFAERFAAAGYACLVFDYRHFGESGGEPRQLLDIGRQREDWRAALAFARTLPGVDTDRIVVWGTSFGGGHVIVTAADDHGIVAAISQCPFTHGLASGLRTPPAASLKIAARAVRDHLARLRKREPVLVPIVGKPGEVALMTAPDALEGCLALNPDEGAEPPEVAARIGLRIPLAFPGRRARDVTCPILFVICDDDSVAPPGPTAKYAGQAPAGETLRFDAGHFDIYVGDWFERNIDAQLEFLSRHVPISR